MQNMYWADIAKVKGLSDFALNVMQYMKSSPILMHSLGQFRIVSDAEIQNSYVAI